MPRYGEMLWLMMGIGWLAVNEPEGDECEWAVCFVDGGGWL